MLSIMRASNKSELKNTDNAKYNDGISMGLRFMLCYNTISRTVGLFHWSNRLRLSCSFIPSLTGSDRCLTFTINLCLVNDLGYMYW